jgi:pimeloyl-ACP methyl ester carboxylesterase
MTSVHTDRPPLTRVPLSDAELPPLADPPPYPGHDVVAAGQLVHVRETPGPDGATPACYVHGLGGSSTNWTELAHQLAGHAPGFALDLPGFGRTRPPEHRDLSLTAQADVVVDTIRTCARGPVHLVGNSMGGAIALLVAEAHPELVRTLTLISPAVPDLRLDLKRVADPRLLLAYLPWVGRPARRSLAALTPQQQARQLLELCFADPDRASAARLALALDEFAERAAMPWAGAVMNAAFLGLLRSWLAPRGKSLWTIASRIQAPALVVWGDSDRLVTVRRGPRTARTLPHGRLLVLPRTGHVAMMERPVTVARAVLGLWSAAARDEW